MVRPKLIDCRRPLLMLAAVPGLSLKKRSRIVVSQLGRAGHLVRAEGWWAGGAGDRTLMERHALGADPEAKVAAALPAALYIANLIIAVRALALARQMDMGLGEPFGPASTQGALSLARGE